MRGIAVGFLCLLGTGTARELQASRITQYLAGTADPSEDTVTDNFVRFQTVAVNRNLRGLFPVTESEDESVGDIRVGAEGPASREASPLAADLQMVGFGGQTAYVTEMMFGDQGPFKAVIDTGSSDTWLVSKNFRCLSQDLQPISNAKCRLGPGYSASASFKQDMNAHFAIQYGDGEKLLGAVGTDHVKVGGLTVLNQRINIVDNAAWNGDGITSGLLGLGFPANTAQYEGTIETDITKPLVYDPFFTGAVKSGSAPTGSFAIALQRDGSTAGTGFLSFGGIPPVRTYGETVTAAFVRPKNSAKGQSEYIVMIDGFKIGSPGVSASSPALVRSEALIDSGTAVLLVPAEVAKAYNNLWNPATQDAPPMSVIISGKEYPIDPTDLRITTGGRSSSAVIASRKTILGDTFMRNVVSVFDVGAGQMRFASTNPAAGPEQAMAASAIRKRDLQGKAAMIETLKLADIVPTVLPEFSSDVTLKITYNGKDLGAGNELSKAETAASPALSITGPQSSKYTVVMFDPDAPKNAGQGIRQAAFLHAIATGVVPGSGTIDFGELAKAGVPYIGPGPPAASGLHRYIFAAFEEQSTGDNPTAATAMTVKSTSRRGFRIDDFMTTHQLKLSAATYMVVQAQYMAAPVGFVKPSQQR